MKKKGFLFYFVAVLTVLSAGFSAFTLKQSLAGAAYYEYEAPVPIVQEIQPVATSTPVIVIATSSPSIASTTSVTTKPTPTPTIITHPTYPSRLLIPSLSIDALVQQTGLTKTGAMGIPTNFKDVAWYKDGTIPGEIGNAVIDGHVDNAIALPGVFKHLDQIKIGDDIYVKNKKGDQVHFVVSAVNMYDYREVPTQEIFGPTTEAILHLITCGGTWIKESKTYDTRVIVTAKLIP